MNSEVFVNWLFDLATGILVVGMSIGLYKFIKGLIHNKMKKDLTHVENTNNEEQDNHQEGLHTGQLVIDTLKAIGCVPEKIEDNEMRFDYQGGTFNLLFKDDSPFITLRFLFWHEFSTYDLDRFAVMQKTVNKANMKHTCKVFYTIDKESETVDLHSEYKTVFIKEIPKLDLLLRGILQDLFHTRHYVYNIIESAVGETDEQ